MNPFRQIFTNETVGKTIARIVYGSDECTILFTDDTLLHILPQGGWEGENEITTAEAFDPLYDRHTAIALGIVTAEELAHHDELAKKVRDHDEREQIKILYRQMHGDTRPSELPT